MYLERDNFDFIHYSIVEFSQDFHLCVNYTSLIQPLEDALLNKINISIRTNNQKS